MVRPCVLRHRVTVLTLGPLGEPEIAIGHEPRIEPWLPRIESLAKSQESADVVTTRKMNRGNGRANQSKTSRAIESHLHPVGWISRRKTSRLPAEGEVFFLTSLFIEPPISKCDIAVGSKPFRFETPRRKPRVVFQKVQKSRCTKPAGAFWHASRALRHKWEAKSDGAFSATIRLAGKVLRSPLRRASSFCCALRGFSFTVQFCAQASPFTQEMQRDEVARRRNFQ